MRPHRTAAWMVLTLLSLSFLGCQNLIEVLIGHRDRKPVTDAEKQTQTVRDMRNLGTAMFSWLTDQVGAAAAGQPANLDLQLYSEISAAELEKLLVPNYIAELPKTDAWGHPFEVRLNVDKVTAENVMSIRSPGRDGKYSAMVYGVEPFAPENYDQDLVWADGFFVRWPERPAGSATLP